MQENNRRNGDKPKGTSLKALLREEFQADVKDSKDPENAWLPDLTIRKTTMYSPWYMRLCLFCGLEFREDDLMGDAPSHDDGFVFWVHRGFVGSGKGNQCFQLWSHVTNMPPARSQGMPDQDGLVTIDTPFPTNPR